MSITRFLTRRPYHTRSPSMRVGEADEGQVLAGEVGRDRGRVVRL